MSKDNPFKGIGALLPTAEEAEAEREDALHAAAESKIKSTTTGKHHRKRKRSFVIVPADWVNAISQIRPHPPWGVAIFLLCAFRRQASRQVVVANGALEAWGVGRNTKLRDLRALEAAGLIEVELQSGNAPRVSWVVDPNS